MSSFIVGKITSSTSEKCGRLLYDLISDISATQNRLEPLFTKQNFSLIDKNMFYNPTFESVNYFNNLGELPATTEAFNWQLNDQLFAPVKNFFSNLWQSAKNSNVSKTVRRVIGKATRQVYETAREVKSVVYSSLQSVGYNASLGARIAADAIRHAESSSRHRCAHYVGNVMDRLGIHWKRTESAADLANHIAQNNRFREVSVSSVELSKLPAGCVLVYPRGAANYSAKHGHVEITLGNGKAASDFVNNNIKYSPNVRIFVPVA